jgi:mRNA interferase HigB
MQVIDAHIIARFARRHAGARKPLQRWLDEANAGIFEHSRAVKERWSSASFLSGNRVIFNIGGNEYRLLVRFDYLRQTVTVLDVGTHQEYDTWNL